MAAIAGAIGGSVVSGIFSSMGGKAQANAAKYAANLQYQLGQQSLGFQEQQFNTNQQNIAPWLKAGTQSIGTLAQLLSSPGQGLLTPWTQTFQAPTAAQAAATPGYQFAAGAGSGAIQNSAAGAGNLLSTGTLKSLIGYNQGLASTTYQQTYQNAFNEYLTQYNQFQNNQTNTFNRLAAVSGVGQTAATTLGQLGNQAASNIAGINASTGAQVGSNINLGAAATASGYAGIANAINSGIGGVYNAGLNNQYLALLNSLMQNNRGGGDFGAPQASLSDLQDLGMASTPGGLG